MIADSNIREEQAQKKFESWDDYTRNQFPDSHIETPPEYVTAPSFFYDADNHEYYAGLADDIEQHNQLVSQSAYDNDSSIVYNNQNLVVSDSKESSSIQPIIVDEKSEKKTKPKTKTIKKSKITVLPNLTPHEVNEAPDLVSKPLDPKKESALDPLAPIEHRLYSPKLVVQQNKLLESFKELNIYERRLLLYLSTTIRAEVRKNPAQDTFLVHVRDFARAFGLEKGNHLNSFMRQSGKSMQTKTFTYQHEEDGFLDDVDVNFAFRFRYRPRTDQMWVTLASEVVHMLTVFDADHPFTYYELGDVVNMKNQNSINLFEHLVRFRKVKKRTLSVEYMRKIFKCENKYPLITDFMRYVVKIAFDEINNLTSFKVKMKIEKNGGTPVAVAFTFTDTKQDMHKKGKELALIDFGYTTESEISKHNENKALKLSESQLRRVVTRKKFVDDHQLSPNSPENANMMVYYNHMIDRLMKDASFVVKHTLDYYLEQTEDAS